MKLNRKFLSPDGEGGGYGYAEDEPKVSPFKFGGNFGNCFLKTFQWIPNGGAQGVEQEALEIVFTINGVDKSARQFPVTKVFNKQGGEITDTNSEDYKKGKIEAETAFSAYVTHILHAFQDRDTVKAALSRGFKSFKDYCQACANLLPKDFDKKPLDIFLQYQWNASENQNRTYLEIPKKMKYGPWLKPAMPGTWTEHRAEHIVEDTKEALWYTNEQNDKHPFIKNGWFMLSNFAKVQNVGGASSQGAASMNAGSQVSNQGSSTSSSQQGTGNDGGTTGGAAKAASAW